MSLTARPWIRYTWTKIHIIRDRLTTKFSFPLPSSPLLDNVFCGNFDFILILIFTIEGSVSRYFCHVLNNAKYPFHYSIWWCLYPWRNKRGKLVHKLKWTSALLRLRVWVCSSPVLTYHQPLLPFVYYGIKNFCSVDKKLASNYTIPILIQV